MLTLLKMDHHSPAWPIHTLHQERREKLLFLQCKDQKSTKKATTASTMKSKLAASQMEAIISGIKQKYNQQSIANMSQEELQSEVMNEIMNSSVAKS